MTDQSLREALEPLIAASEAHGARFDFQLARFRTMLAEQEVNTPLAPAHPAEPASEGGPHRGVGMASGILHGDVFGADGSEGATVTNIGLLLKQLLQRHPDVDLKTLRIDIAPVSPPGSTGDGYTIRAWAEQYPERGPA